MQKEKEAKAKIQIIFSGLLLASLVIVEFYSAVNYPKQYIAIGIFGVLILVSLFFLTNSIFSLMMVKQERREEQYDSIFKSEKASYLLLKKYFEQIDEKIDLLQESSKIPTEEIVNAQKGVAKVIINRSRENAEALMNSNDLLMDKLYEFEDKLNANSKEILEGQKANEEEKINELILKQQELMNGLKDMELRINQAIMQTQQIISSNPVQLTANVEIPPQQISLAQVPTPMMTMPVQPIMSENVSMPSQAQEIQEIKEEPPVMEESVVEEEPVIEESPVMEEPVVEEEPVIEEPVVEEPTTMPDMSDPNKKMSPDDIAALFASMGGDDSAVENETEVEKVEEVPSVAEELVVEEEPTSMPDMSDPNKKMSPDDIAALFASMGGGDEAPVEEIPVEEPKGETTMEEPVVEEKPAMPDMSDPNKQLSADEIAALFANMNGDDSSLDTLSDEPAIEEIPVEEPVVEEKPAMPDMSDPNKMMSPDEIAALIANM